MIRRGTLLLLLLPALLGTSLSRIIPASAASPSESGAAGAIRRIIGPGDAVMAADPRGRTVLSIHADRMLMPASTLKILTSLVARHHLGPGHRFQTEFYLDSRNNLKIKGYGDPLLISEVMREIAATLAERIRGFNDLIVDGTHFSAVTIPGVTDTLNPYDAPCGALSVNFNTVTFKRSEGEVVSAEPQTPIVPFILGRIRKTGLAEGRIVLAAENGESTLYAGHLFRRYLADAGVASAGAVRTGRVESGEDRLLYRYTSVFTLDEIIERLLMHSNNFMANQLLIAAGIAAAGPPGTLRKGVQAAEAYIREELGRKDIRIAEGSGISRENRITPACMMRILAAFAPLHHLMKEEEGVYFKTGTLSGVKTRAGYIRAEGGGLAPFVVMMNTPDKRPEPVVSGLRRMLREED